MKSNIIIWVGETQTRVSSEFLDLLDKDVCYNSLVKKGDIGSIVVVQNRVKFDIMDEDGDFHSVDKEVSDEMMSLLFDGDIFIEFKQRDYGNN